MNNNEKIQGFKRNDDVVNCSRPYQRVELIGVRGYSQIYFEECRYIWRNMIPKSGQANNLQGEMLRMVVKLSNEAINKGNINWDDNFEWFCDFLKENLINCGLFDEQKIIKIKMILDYIKSNGNYARDFANGEISDNQLDILKLAYTDDDIYDYLSDAIAEYYLDHKTPIPYEIKDFIYR